MGHAPLEIARQHLLCFLNNLFAHARVSLWCADIDSANLKWIIIAVKHQHYNMIYAALLYYYYIGCLKPLYANFSPVAPYPKLYLSNLNPQFWMYSWLQKNDLGMSAPTFSKWEIKPLFNGVVKVLACKELIAKRPCHCKYLFFCCTRKLIPLWEMLVFDLEPWFMAGHRYNTVLNRFMQNLLYKQSKLFFF